MARLTMMRIPGWSISRDTRLTENIAEQHLNPVKHITRSINRNRVTGPQGEGSQVIDPVDMIGMGMGIEDAVNLLNTFTQRLLPKISGGVNQDFMTGPLEQHTATGSVIARLRR